MLRSNLFGFLLVVLAGASLAADAPPVPRDPQSSYEPRSQPGAGQAFLEKFVGDWAVTKKFYPASGAAVEVSGTCHQTMIHDGRFLKSEFIFSRDGKTITGLGIVGFEPSSGKFTSFWTDSRSTRMSIRQSDDKFNGDEIVLRGRSLDPAEEPKRQSRTITRVDPDGSRVVHRQFTTGRDGTERLVMELIMTRAAGASAAKN